MSKRDEEAREREKREREKREHNRKGERGDRERHSGGDDEREFEHDKGNAAHIEIEERRFRGGLPPTPELYARAREQWNQLPGSAARPGKGPEASKPPADSETKPAGAGVDEDNKEGSR
jgi:hypothetical protein